MTDPRVFMLSFERQPNGLLTSNVLPFCDARIALQALGCPLPPEGRCHRDLPVRIFIETDPDGTLKAGIGVVVLSGQGIADLLETCPQSSS